MSINVTSGSDGSYLLPSLRHATVADAMHPGIISCGPDASISEIARVMATNHVHCLAVVGVSHADPECGVWGVISDLDLVREGVRSGEEVTARSLAGQPLVTVDPTMPLRGAAKLMLRHGTSHLVVVDADTERPIGILSTLDVAGILAWGNA
jgi:CBS domain-containing protein